MQEEEVTKESVQALLGADDNDDWGYAREELYLKSRSIAQAYVKQCAVIEQYQKDMAVIHQHIITQTQMMKDFIKTNKLKAAGVEG